MDLEILLKSENGGEMTPRPYEVKIEKMPDGRSIQVSINDYPTYFFSPDKAKRAERLKDALLKRHYYEVKLAQSEEKIERILRPWAFK